MDDKYFIVEHNRFDISIRWRWPEESHSTWGVWKGLDDDGNVQAAIVTGSTHVRFPATSEYVGESLRRWRFAQVLLDMLDSIFVERESFDNESIKIELCTPSYEVCAASRLPHYVRSPDTQDTTIFVPWVTLGAP